MTQMHHRIPYVQSASSLDVPPPYHFPGVTVNAFIWKAQMGPIQAYCDKYFNLGKAEDRGFTYRPAPFWPYATLLFLEYPVMISSNDTPQDIGEMPYSDRGIVSQTEVFVAMPVVRYGHGIKNLITCTEIEWMMPFIAVGNPMSAVCGREMLGLGKLLADIGTGVGWYPDSFKGTVNLPGWKKMEPGEMQQDLRFLTVETKPVLPTFRTSGKLRTIASLFETRQASWMLDGMAALGNFIDIASGGLIPTSMRTIGLKQYRDAKQVDKAVYQALVSCRSLFSNVTDLQFYDEKDVTIEVGCEGSFEEIVSLLVDSDEEQLGPTINATPLAASRFKADIDFDSMSVVYDFPINGPKGTPNHPASSNIDARWYRPIKGFFGPGRRV